MPSTIAVVGATGKQGGSVARSLLQNPSIQVRAVTRDQGSDASQSLASAGAEVVQASGFHRAEMVAALRGASGAAIVDSAIEAGVQDFVYSGGPPCTEMTGGKVSMKAMDMKYRVEQYARQRGKFRSIVIVNPAWYLENFLVREVAPVFGGFPYFPDSEGFLTFRVPHWGGDNQVPFLSITEDYGDLVHAIFLDPARWNGRVIHGASEIIGFDELTATFEAVTGKKARFEPIQPNWEAFDTCGIPELEDVKLMFGFTQSTNGRYFGEDASEKNTAAELKRITAQTLGRSEEKGQLQTAERFFRTHFQ